MYTTERYEASVSVEEYLEGYVDVETFLECCKKCPHYGKSWSCPPYDFDVLEYWRKYRTFDLVAIKILFEDTYAGKTCSEEEMQKILEASIWKVKKELSEELLLREKGIPGSVSLSAGSCGRCLKGCSRGEGKPCRFPEEMRYSIESLGGNVGLTISRLMGVELEWMEEGKIPRYFVLVCGLLRGI